MNRRGFLAGILASGYAPAAVGSGVLMPIKQLVLPPDGLYVFGEYTTEYMTATEVVNQQQRFFVRAGSGLDKMLTAEAVFLARYIRAVLDAAVHGEGSLRLETSALPDGPWRLAEKP